jgi:hypothetical protein
VKPKEILIFFEAAIILCVFCEAKKKLDFFHFEGEGEYSYLNTTHFNAA